MPLSGDSLARMLWRHSNDRLSRSDGSFSLQFVHTFRHSPMISDPSVVEEATSGFDLIFASTATSCRFLKDF